MPTMGPAPKVTREGVVTVNGKTVGSVERTRKDTSIYATIGNFDGPVKWIPKDIDGKPISDPRDTRRDAVRMVAAHAEPLTVEVTRKKDLWHAEVRVQGSSLGATRHDAESHWFVHFVWAAGAIIPSLSTLPGTRPARAIVRQDVIDMLNEAANKQGAWFTS